MNTGKALRLKRISFQNLFLFSALDHGVTLGSVQGIDTIEKTINKIHENSSAIIIHKGILKSITTLNISCGIIVHLSASTILGEINNKVLVASVDEGLILGADAISVHVNLNCPNESQMLKDLGKISEDCYKRGMPLLAMMYIKNPDGSTIIDPIKIGHAARVAFELGADIIKIPYTGSENSLKELTSKISVPIVIAGGDKVSDEETCQFATKIMECGAKGISFGRKIYESKNIENLMPKLKEILLQKI